MSIFLYAILLILFTSTLVQGHDNLDVNTAENLLIQHNNPIRIGKLK